MADKGTITQEKNGDLVITRTFDAPPELVWKAWTDPEQMKRWWGPKGFTAPVAEIDPRVGGKYLLCMRGGDDMGDFAGKDFWNTGTFIEIISGKKIVYTDNFSDKSGNIIPASAYGLPGDWSKEVTVTVTFEDLGGKTKMTVRQSGLPGGEMNEMTGQGWNGSFDKLAESLDKPDEILS